MSDNQNQKPNAVKTYLQKITNSNNNGKYDNIYIIYLQLKDKILQSTDSNIKIIINKINEKKYTDIQYFILAHLIYRLENFEKLTKNEKKYERINRTHIGIINKYLTNVATKNVKIKINDSINSILTNIDYNYYKEKSSIIIKFIDEYIEVSNKNSEFGKKISNLLIKCKKNIEILLKINRIVVDLLKDKNIEDAIIKLFDEKIFENLQKGTINLQDFFKLLFEYSISVIDNNNIRKILEYILYFLVNNDMGIPKEINELFGNENFDASNNKELGEILNLLGELSENLTLRRLFYLLSKQKRKLLHKPNKLELLPTRVPNFLVNKSNNNIKFIKNTLNEPQTDIVVGLIVSKYEFNEVKNIFLQKIFNFIGESIKNDKVRDILTYIIYLLVEGDIRIPLKIDNRKINFENTYLYYNLFELLNFVEENKQKKMKRLLQLLQQEKIKNLKPSRKLLNPWNIGPSTVLTAFKNSPNSNLPQIVLEMPESNNKRNLVMVESIKSFIQGLKKDNIDDIILILINILKEKVNKNILGKFPQLLNYQLSIFLSKLFNNIIQYISDKDIQIFLTYIVYYFTNPKMILPKDIENYYSHYTPWNKFKDIELFKLLEFVFDKTQPPEILIKLFNLLSTRIYEIKRNQKKI
jgi:hypothetical protein